MGSTQRSYRNSAFLQSGNPRFLVDKVRASRFSQDVIDTVVCLMKNNPAGDDMWLSTESLQVIAARPTYTRKRTGSSGTRRRADGKIIEVHYGPCHRVSRRTMQKRIDRAVEEKAIRVIWEANTPKAKTGLEIHRPSATYAVIAENMIPRETWEEWNAKKQEAKRKATPIRSGKDVTFVEAFTGRKPN